MTEPSSGPRPDTAEAAETVYTLNLTVNGRPRTGVVPTSLLLSEYLRDHLGLTGTHVGCDTSQCGACTVLVDGLMVKSCTVLVAQLPGAAVLTIEGLGSRDKLHPVQEAFRARHALQCGFCTPGMVAAAVALLSENPHPTAEEVREGLDGVMCRCTGYENIVAAVLDAADRMPGAAKEVG
jgi:carbon-monoxide dehydrogenase small subunit